MLPYFRNNTFYKFSWNQTSIPWLWLAKNTFLTSCNEVSSNGIVSIYCFEFKKGIISLVYIPYIDIYLVIFNFYFEFPCNNNFLDIDCKM